jgi:site-specific recombinase XerC
LYTHVTVDHLREVFLETHPRARRRPSGEED